MAKTLNRRNLFEASLATVILVSLCPYLHAYLEYPADVVIYREDNVTYAELGTLKIAQQFNLTPNLIIAEDTNSSAVIQKAVEKLFEIYAGEEKKEKKGRKDLPAGKILIKAGSYDLGSEGIKFPYGYYFLLQGEGEDKTFFTYKGGGNAIEYDISSPEDRDKCQGAVFEAENFTVQIKGNAENGIFIAYPNHVFLRSITVLADEGTQPQNGISVEAGGGNIKLLANLTIKGPFQKGLFLPTDHLALVNIEVEGFRNHGIAGGQRAWGIRLFTRSPDARIGIGGGGGILYNYEVRCLGRWNDRKTVEEHAKAISENRGAGFVEVVDSSPSLPDYTPFVVGSGCLTLAGCKPKRYKESGLGRINWVEEDKWREIVKDPDRVTGALPREIDTSFDAVIFKADKRYAQLKDELITAESDRELFKKVFGLFPQGARIYVKGHWDIGDFAIPSADYILEGSYSLQWPRLPQERSSITPIVFNGIDENGKEHTLHLRHILAGGGVKILGGSAVIEDVNALGVGIIIGTKCRNVVLAHNTVIARSGDCDIDDAGQGTIILNPQPWGMRFNGPHGIKLGRRGILLGGHAGKVITNPPKHEEGLSKEWRVANRGLVVGMFDECGGSSIASRSNLYLLGCSGHIGLEEKDGGEVCVVR